MDKLKKFTKKYSSNAQPQLKTSEFHKSEFKASSLSEYKDSLFDFAIKDSYLCKKNENCKNCKREKCFGIYEMQTKDLVKVFEKLAVYKSKTWREIETGHQHNMSTGKIPIDKLETKKMINNHLNNIIGPDPYDFYELEIDGRHRVWGFRDYTTFYIIWNDPEHRFYKPTNKNHTNPKNSQLQPHH